MGVGTGVSDGVGVSGVGVAASEGVGVWVAGSFEGVPSPDITSPDDEPPEGMGSVTVRLSPQAANSTERAANSAKREMILL